MVPLYSGCVHGSVVQVTGDNLGLQFVWPGGVFQRKVLL